MADYPLAARLSAEAQTDAVDRHLDRLSHGARAMQHQWLIEGSRDGRPIAGLMASQVPRAVAFGMALGRYPTTALRDVTLAVTSVMVDDQIVAPLVRMGRRGHHMGLGGSKEARIPTPEPSAPKNHRPGRHKDRSGHVARAYEDALVLMWSTGQAVMAAPLNAATLLSAYVGAGVGLVTGCLMAAVVGLFAPRALVRHLCPSLAVLTQLTRNFELVELAKRSRERARSHPNNEALQRRAQEVHRAVAQALQQHDAAMRQVCGNKDPQVLARDLDRQLLQRPGARQFLGLGAYPKDNVDRLIEARRAFDAHHEATALHFGAKNP